MGALPPDLADRAGRIRWLLSDVDGVLTDGRLYYDSHGESLKAFDVKDGLGLKLAQRAGIRVGVLSSRASAALDQRTGELGLDASMTGHANKRAAFDEFLRERGLEPEDVAYVGDDLPDLVVLALCGLSFAPADAVKEVREVVDVVLERPGGQGALREAVETLLRARGDWQRIRAALAADG